MKSLVEGDLTLSHGGGREQADPNQGFALNYRRKKCGYGDTPAWVTAFLLTLSRRGLVNRNWSENFRSSNHVAILPPIGFGACTALY